MPPYYFAVSIAMFLQLFVRTPFDIGTEEGERVALDHVSKVAPAGEDSSIREFILPASAFVFASHY